MTMCDYGCGQEARYKMSSGKLCCCRHYNSCPENRRKNSEGLVGKRYGPFSDDHKKRMSEAKIEYYKTHMNMMVVIGIRIKNVIYKDRTN